MRKIKREEVICSVCNISYIPKYQQSTPSLKYFCPDCRGMSIIKCPICNKEFNKRNSVIRKGKNFYCSIECKAISQRKEWDCLSRSNLKQRWIAEFGIENFTCKRCGHDKTYNIALHHITYVCNGGSNMPDNLEPLCLNCHGIEHYEKGSDSDE